MLPLGYLGPSPGWGNPRHTRLSPAEQRTLMTLWCIFRSPLMMGGDLPHNDAATTDLLTNDEVLAVDQHSTGDREAVRTADAVVWTAAPVKDAGYYIAGFNMANHPQDVSYTFEQLGLGSGKYVLRDLWEHSETGPVERLSLHLGPHASALYRATLVSGK
jgi:hypothetical protein